MAIMKKHAPNAETNLKDVSTAARNHDAKSVEELEYANMVYSGVDAKNVVVVRFVNMEN